jgi:hypothetical protein
MCEGSTGNGLLCVSSTIKRLLYAHNLLLQSICSEEGPHSRLGAKREKAVIWQATNATYGMGTFRIPLQSICSKEGPHYRLGAKREEVVRRQATINLFTSLDIPGDSIPGLYCVAWLTQESVSSRIFVKKKGMNPVQSNGRSLWQKAEKGNSTVVMLLPDSHECLVSRNPCVLFQKHGGACTMY